MAGRTSRTCLFGRCKWPCSESQSAGVISRHSPLTEGPFVSLRRVAPRQSGGRVHRDAPPKAGCPIDTMTHDCPLSGRHQPPRPAAAALSRSVHGHWSACLTLGPVGRSAHLGRGALCAARGQTPVAVVARELAGAALVAADAARLAQLQLAVEVAAGRTPLCGTVRSVQVTWRSEQLTGHNLRGMTKSQRWFNQGAFKLQGPISSRAD